MNRSLDSRSNFSASTTFSRNQTVGDPIVPMAMSSSTIPTVASGSPTSTARMTQSYMPSKSTSTWKK